MSLKRSHASTRTGSGAGSDSGSKLGRQEFFDELKKHAQTGQAFSSVDISMAIGANEAAVSRALIGLSTKGYIEKLEVGKYRSTPFLEVPQADFLKALARASKTDSTRQRDLSEIGRLKQNNDVMRAKLLGALAERDHYLAVLKQHGIDPGPVPAPASASSSAAPPAAAPTAPAAPAAAAPSTAVAIAPTSSAPVEPSTPAAASGATTATAAAPPAEHPSD